MLLAIAETIGLSVRSAFIFWAKLNNSGSPRSQLKHRSRQPGCGGGVKVGGRGQGEERGRGEPALRMRRTDGQVSGKTAVMASA
jgi:hypothetical protein